MGASDRHASDTLRESHRAWIERLPTALRPVDGVFMCHATPHNDVDCYLEDLVDGELRPAPVRSVEERSLGCDASLILCGHSHIPRVMRLRTGQLVVNPGSVGIQAYQGNDPGPHVVEAGSPHARYAILESTSRGWKADLVAVPYDWDEAAKLAAHNGRDDWARALATGFVRQVPQVR